MRQKKLKLLPWIILTTGFLSVFLFAKWLLKDDFMVFLQWNVALILLGVIFYPITGLIFHKFYDGGWLFIRRNGVLASVTVT